MILFLLRLMQEITLNGSFLSEMKAKNDERKRLVSQLEFDVNVVEREGKRLEADLNKVLVAKKRF